MDQVGTVIHRLDLHAFRQAGGNFDDLGLEIVDHLQRVDAVTRHGDAGHHFAFAVEFGDAASLVRPQFDPGDVANQHRRALVAFHHQQFDVALAAQITLAAHHVLGFGHFHHTPADVAVGVANHLGDLGQGNRVSPQLHRIHRDLVGLHEPADGGDFSHPLRLGELVAQIPVLDGTQFRQRLVLGQYRILIDPADAGGVRPERRRHALGHAPRREIQVFEHARARPVDVGAVFENDVDERGAEE